MKHLGREELVRIFAGTAFQGEEEHASRHLVGCGPCSGLAAEVVAELAARQALAPGKSSVRVLADLLREKEEMFVRSLQAKAWVVSELERMGYRALPSATNFLMTDLRRPVPPVILALRQRNVEVGRLFPAMPTHLRVTIGTMDQMKKFVGALEQVLA